MGARTPRKPVRGKPPEGMGEGGPKVTPAPLPTDLSPIIDRFPDKGTTGDSRRSTRRKKGTDPDKGGLFAELMEGIRNKYKNKMKEGGKGIGGPVTAPGFPSDKPKGRPIFDDRVYMGGSSPIPGVGGHEYLNDPKYAEHRKEYYGKKEKQRERERMGEEYVKNRQREESKRPKGRPAPDFLREKMLAQKGPKKPTGGIKTPAFGDIGVGGGPGDIPPRFPGGPRDPRTMRGPRREGVFFGEKESPKKVMRKAGSPVDAETKNKFEEMLAYMKSFQR